MATVADVVDNAITFLDRRDLQDLFFKKLPQIIRSVHALQKFRKDLAVYKIVDPVLIDSQLVLQPSDIPNIREIVQIDAFTGYHTSVVASAPVIVGDNQVSWEFRDLSTGQAKSDYFGFQYTHGWNVLGSNATVVGLDSSIKLLDIHAVVWPTWEYNAITDVYSSSSWILEQFPQLIEQHLIVLGARDSQNMPMLNNERSVLVDLQEEFLNEFTGDIYNGSQPLRSH